MLLWTGQELVIAREGAQQNLRIVAIHRGPGEEVSTDHLEAITPGFARSEHQSRGFDRLLDDRNLTFNDSLERDIAELLTRPVGRSSHKPVVWYKGFLYQAASWKIARRVVAKVEFHFGENR